MDINLFRKQLGGQFSHAVKILARLDVLLFQEREALSQRDPEAIKDVIGEKMTLLKTLEGIYDAITQLAAERDSASGGAGLLYCIDTPELSQLWNELRGRLDECHHKNQVNGGIIEVGRAHTDRLFRIIRGEEHRPALYKPDGKLQSPAAAQAIARV